MTDINQLNGCHPVVDIGSSNKRSKPDNEEDEDNNEEEEKNDVLSDDEHVCNSHIWWCSLCGSVLMANTNELDTDANDDHDCGCFDDSLQIVDSMITFKGKGRWGQLFSLNMVKKRNHPNILDPEFLNIFHPWKPVLNIVHLNPLPMPLNCIFSTMMI